MTYTSPEFEIGIDVDDVLVTCHDRICAEASEEVGHFVDPYTTPHGIADIIGKAAAKRVWARIDAIPRWNSQAPIQEAVAALDSLRALGTVVAITSPHTAGTWMNDRADFLRSIGFARKNVIQSAGKFRIPVHVLLDDLGQNLVDWKKRNRSGLAIQIEASHNQATPVPLGCFRHNDWSAIIAQVVLAKQLWEADQGHGMRPEPGEYAYIPSLGMYELHNGD